MLENAAFRLSAPGLGKELGANLGVNRSFYQGLFLAPNVVLSALKGAIFAANIYEKFGFSCFPNATEERYDIIQAINLNIINAGIDMRNISTDHIESIEIIRGISSAQDGNLSSGAIHINSRKGVTPWRIRAKADPLNKLIYVGKGFKLSDKAGLLHIGIDGLSST